MSSEPNPDEIPVEVVSENQSETGDISKSSETSQLDIDELSKLLDIEKQKATEYEDKFKHVLADFQNLEKKTQSDIQNGVNSKVDEFMLDFLKIYDDFVRAKEVFSKIEVDVEGLDSILKNMDALFEKISNSFY